MEEITVVMALYKPDLHWLKEELRSLAGQTYQNFRLLVWNDCPDDSYDYDRLLAEFFPKTIYAVYQGETNMGSNAVFAKLTSLVMTPYIAYCDQDDVWMPEKLSVLKRVLEEKQVDLVCSDMYVINGKSRIVADSITKIRPHQLPTADRHPVAVLLRRNFVTGCTILMRTDLAQKLLPFPDAFYHDHWLALGAAMREGIYAVPKPLIKYRIYGQNQTGTLKDVKDKNSYYEGKILKDNHRMKAIEERMASLAPDSQAEQEIRWYRQWTAARVRYFQHPAPGNFAALYRMRTLGQGITFFELLLPFLPPFLFKIIVSCFQKGKI